MTRCELSQTPDAIRQRENRRQFAALKALGDDWDARNPGACPDCKGRPGEQDWKAEGGGEHALWCTA